MGIIKRIIIYILNKLDRVCSALSSVVGAILITQFPHFLVQYLQRLGGRIDEATLVAQKTKLPEWIERSKELQSGFQAIHSASSYMKLPKFLIHFDWDTTQKTLNQYIPGISFDKIGFYYMLIGLLLGLLVYGFLKLICKKIGKRIFKKKIKKKQPVTEYPDITEQITFPENSHMQHLNNRNNF